MLARISILPIAATLALGLLGGCKKPEYPACKKDKHCNTELAEACVDGSCQNCKTDEDCTDKGAATVCHQFRCQDPSQITEGAGGGDKGDPCTQRMDCFGGLVCSAGKCADCTEDIECSPSTCTVETGRCDAAGQCTVDDECPMDEICDGGMCIFSGDVGGGEAVCGLDAVYFGFDSDKLTPKNQELLTAAAECMINEGTTVTLEAHADNVGTEEYNILLTDKRGNSVKSFLESKGVPAEQLSVVGKGALEATGSSESERAKDRRVNLVGN